MKKTERKKYLAKVKKENLEIIDNKKQVESITWLLIDVFATYVRLNDNSYDPYEDRRSNAYIRLYDDLSALAILKINNYYFGDKKKFTFEGVRNNKYIYFDAKDQDFFILDKKSPCHNNNLVYIGVL